MPLDRQQTAAIPAVLRNVPGVAQVLTPDALHFLGEPQSRFGLRLHGLIVARGKRQAQYGARKLPDCRDGTKPIRRGICQVDAVLLCWSTAGSKSVAHRIAGR